MMSCYHKINGLYNRDHKTGKFIFGEFCKPEFEYLYENHWIGTEKIDGTNVRIGYDGQQVTFGGRTEKSQMPVPLLAKLQELFPIEKLHEVFKNNPAVTLYGEGYGGNIQAVGPRLSKDFDFILFDVKIGHYWLQHHDMASIADSLGIKYVPIRCCGPLSHLEAFVGRGFKSLISEDPDLISEGLIAVPAINLLSRNGARIITKLKHKDYAGKE